MTEPERWLTSTDAPGPMRDMLLEAQKVGPSTLERAALAGKLGVATSGLAIVPALKGLAFATLVAGGVWVAATGGAPLEPAAPRLAPSVVQQAPVAQQVPVAKSEPVTSEAEPNAERQIKREQNPSEGAPPTVVPPESSSKEARVAPAPARSEMKKPSETSLIAGARNSLEASPDAALRLLSQHAKIYPSGILAEEREVLRIRALKSLGRAKDAQLQQQKFRKEHPESAHHLP